ncbi:MAG: hypothetical protein D6739_12380 [Nitrospirae bacterium]|nr:MAG: hypothetical protein D6739_12380 [Nitrospirota bacterium]
MQIDAYRFGRITIDGRDYTSDVILAGGRVRDGWWRRQGHRLDPEDLAEVVAARPRRLLVGTGASGCMAVPPETVAWLAERGIEVEAAPTPEAVARFNREGDDPEVAACFHLTC